MLLATDNVCAFGCTYMLCVEHPQCFSLLTFGVPLCNMLWAKHLTLLPATDLSCALLQHAMDNGWLIDREGKPKLVAVLSSAHEASLGLAQLHRGGAIHGGLSPATCFLKAARNQRGFVVKVRRYSLIVQCMKYQHHGI